MEKEENRVQVGHGKSYILYYRTAVCFTEQLQHLNICYWPDSKQIAASAAAADGDNDDETHLNPPSRQEHVFLTLNSKRHIV